MSIPLRDFRLLCQRSGNRCAFDGCHELLTMSPENGAELVVLGHVAHIVGQSRRGPRGEAELAADDRDSYANLILLCGRHHRIVDAQPQLYTALRLETMKEAHESWVETTLKHSTQGSHIVEEVFEKLHSNLMLITQLPTFVYSAPSEASDFQVVEYLRGRSVGGFTPWVTRSSRLHAFQDLQQPGSPFAGLIDRDRVERYRVAEWLADHDRSLWLIAMLNRALNELGRRRGLRFDPNHRRLFFAPASAGQEKQVVYKSIRGVTARKRVVYQPRRRRDLSPMPFWIHWALSLRILRISAELFVLSFTPDLRVTKDGVQELPSSEIGEKVTRRKGRWYNFETLSHVHFWRDYLCEGRAHLFFRFSDSSAVVIDTTLVQAEVTWPGIPSEYARSFTEAQYEDDLFTRVEHDLLVGDRSDGEHEDDESDA